MCLFGLVLRLHFLPFLNSYAGNRKQAKPAPHGAVPLFLAGANVYGLKFVILKAYRSPRISPCGPHLEQFFPVDFAVSPTWPWALRLAQVGLVDPALSPVRPVGPALRATLSDTKNAKTFDKPRCGRAAPSHQLFEQSPCLTQPPKPQAHRFSTL